MWQVRWEQEEEDFEGFIKRFRPDSTYCYEVAYDDGDEEWGWFSATHFHTDEVQRRFTWLQEQDEQVAKAASKAWAALEGSQHVLSSFEQNASTASVERTSNAAPKAAATATASVAIGNLALRKDQLRVTQEVVSDSKPVIPSPASGSRHKIGLQQARSRSALLAKPASVSASQQQPASLSDLVPSSSELAVSTHQSAPDAKLAAAPNAKPTVLAPDVTFAKPVASKAAHDGQPIMVQEPSRASQLSREGSLRHKVSPSAAAKLQLETGQQPSKQVTHKKRKAAIFDEPDNSVPETEAPASTHANAHAVNGHVDESSTRETAGHMASAASAQEQPAKQIAQPSPKPASLPETVVWQAEASGNAQEQAQPQGRKSPNHDTGQQQHAGAPRHTKRPSPEKAAKQKAAAERRVKRAHDPLNRPPPSPVKEVKRLRLRKASELHPLSEDAAVAAAAVPPEAPTTGPSELEDLDAEDIQVCIQPSCQHFPCIVGICQT